MKDFIKNYRVEGAVLLFALAVSVLMPFLISEKVGFVGHFFPKSIEVGFASHSPSGANGGLLIPATCPSDEHLPGECAPPPPPPPPPSTANITANGLDGPITIVNNTTATFSWTSTQTSSCSVTKNGGACALAGSACNELVLSGSAGNSGVLAGPSVYTYALSCVSNNGTPNPSDSVVVNTSAATACTDGIDNDGDGLRDFNNGNSADGIQPPSGFLADPGCTSAGDPEEANRYACNQGACVSTEGFGFNTGGCTYVKTYNPSPLADGGTLLPENQRLCATTQCSDGVDNDADTKSDWPGDIGCSGPNDNNETNVPGKFEEVPPT